MNATLPAVLLTALVLSACAGGAGTQPGAVGAPAAVAAAAAASAAAAEAAATAAAARVPVYEGYEAFYATLPDPLFTAQDEVAVQKPGGKGERAGDFWRWTVKGKPHTLELRGADLLIDGRRLNAAKAKRFDGESVAPALGRSATVYANEDALCVEGLPGSYSGTAVRQNRVSLVTQPFGKQARRFELPSLFASCRALTRQPQGAIGFFKAGYRWDPVTQQPQGADLEAWVLKGGNFTAQGTKRSLTFVEAGNVYRFTSP